MTEPLLNAAPADTLIKDTSTKTFREDVLQESMNQPVLVDFWAPWCGPCKQLTPVLEKVVREAKGKVKLVKLDIDANPSIPGQLGIKSIPAVLAFEGGQPVDGFMGNVPESQIKAFIDRLAGPASTNPLEELLNEAEALKEQGDASGAAQLFAAVLTHDPAQLKAIAGLALIYTETGNLDAARHLLTNISPEKSNDPLLAKANAALTLAEQTASLGNEVELTAKLEDNPLDHETRLNLALLFNAKHRRDEAIDQLILIVRKDRSWNDDAARKQILQFFDAWGPMDAATLRGRRKLAAALFG